MTRGTQATLLILAIFWQALVWLTPWGQEQRLADINNTMVHTQALTHHHLSDRSLHMDDPASDTAHHQHPSETFQLIGLLPVVYGFILLLTRSTRFSSGSASINVVFLQVPLRPPQPTVA